jgi:1-acyl-sn-glycerol-3-phosphate acyltransferase
MATKSVLRKTLLIPYQLYVVLFFIPVTIIWKVITIIASFADAKGNLAHRCWSIWARSSLALAGLRVRVDGLERFNPETLHISR